jgi:hypothetical protein
MQTREAETGNEKKRRGTEKLRSRLEVRGKN